MFSQVEDLLPVISFGSKKDGETEKKHTEFVSRMTSRGYTERQGRRPGGGYMRVKQAGSRPARPTPPPKRANAEPRTTAESQRPQPPGTAAPPSPRPSP